MSIEYKRWQSGGAAAMRRIVKIHLSRNKIEELIIRYGFGTISTCSMYMGLLEACSVRLLQYFSFLRAPSSSSAVAINVIKRRSALEICVTVCYRATGSSWIASIMLSSPVDKQAT